MCATDFSIMTMQVPTMHRKFCLPTQQLHRCEYIFNHATEGIYGIMSPVRTSDTT